MSEWKTKAKWESLGFEIKQGQKATKFETDISGFPLLMWHKSQVEKKERIKNESGRAH